MTRRDTFSQPERASQHGCGGAVNAQKSVCVREEAQFYGNIDDDPSIKKGRFVDSSCSCACLVVFSDFFSSLECSKLLLASAADIKGSRRGCLRDTSHSALARRGQYLHWLTLKIARKWHSIFKIHCLRYVCNLRASCLKLLHGARRVVVFRPLRGTWKWYAKYPVVIGTSR